MGNTNKRETVIACLIANTRRRKRPNSLVEIASDIRWLENELGSLKVVSQTIGISTDMLRQFLSLEHLSPEVLSLLKERKIDLINIAHYMHGFDTEAQQTIAQKVVEGKLSANDIRVLAPLHKMFPDSDIEQLILRVQQSKNIRLYVAYFRVPKEFKDISKLKERFERIVGTDEIKSLTVTNQVGMLELTEQGRRKLRDASKKQCMTLKEFVNTIVSETN